MLNIVIKLGPLSDRIDGFVRAERDTTELSFCLPKDTQKKAIRSPARSWISSGSGGKTPAGRQKDQENWDRDGMRSPNIIAGKRLNPHLECFGNREGRCRRWLECQREAVGRPGGECGV